MRGALEQLKNHRIKPSCPRVKILEYLLKHRNHPTIDEIYNSVIQDIPTLSKATVYNTIHLFLDNHLVQQVNIEGTEARYDIDHREHGHFKCEECGQIYDFYFDREAIKVDSLHGFVVNKREIYYRGICATCLSKESSGKK
jgi:Fur family peroxide stress response transcriptional regulator